MKRLKLFVVPKDAGRQMQLAKANWSDACCPPCLAGTDAHECPQCSERTVCPHVPPEQRAALGNQFAEEPKE